MSTALDYDPKRPLYLPTGKRLGIAQSRDAIEEAYSAGKPVLVYIHGRARKVGEPKKSVEQGIYKALAGYGVSVIGFTWDADDGGYDETRPGASVPDFDRFLDALGEHLSSRGAKPALLAHSMGNLIVSELAKDERLTAGRGALFSNMVLSAAAVKTKRHHRWLSEIGVSERTFVMVNPNDKVLGFAGFFLRPDMLGRELSGPGVSPDRAVYVDLSELGLNHRYFAPSQQKGQAHLHAFYSQALIGRPVDFGAISEAASVDGVPVRRIRKI